jgi:hypothetical protein
MGEFETKSGHVGRATDGREPPDPQPPVAATDAMVLKVYQRSSDDDCRDDTGWKKLQFCGKPQPPIPRLGDTTREAPCFRREADPVFPLLQGRSSSRRRVLGVAGGFRGRGRAGAPQAPTAQ